MECPASNGSECTSSSTIYFQKVFLTSDDSARKGNIKDLGKVTILFFFFFVIQDWGAGGGFKDISEEEKKMELILDALLDFVERSTTYKTL